MNIYAIPTLFTAAILGSIGVFVFLKNRKSAPNVVFGFFCLSMVVWLSGFSLMYLSKEPQTALIWAKIGFIGIVFIPFLAYHFILSFLGIRNRFIPWLYLLGILSILLNYFSGEVYKGVTLHPWGYYPVAGKYYFIFIVIFVGFFSYGAWLLYRSLKDTSLPPLKRQQIKYILLPFAPGIGATVDYIGKYPGVNIYPFGYLFTLAFTAVIAFAIIKYRLMDIRVAVTRAGIFLVFFTFILGIPFYVGIQTHSWLLSTTIGVILALLGPIIYRILQDKTDNILLFEQRHYQKILMQASEGMIAEHNLDKLVRLTVHIIKRSVRITYAAVFIQDKETNSYRLKAFRKSGSAQIASFFPGDHPLVSFIHSHKEPFTIDELPQEVKVSLKGNTNMELIIPAFIQDKSLGFLVLGSKLNGTTYIQDDINVFKTLANQAALAIENCLFIEDQKMQERLFAAEKLALFGGMADGLAHQIKNRLNQFSMCGGELSLETQEILDNMDALTEKKEDLRDKLKYILSCSDSISANVKKTNTVIQGILNFARIEIKETFFSEFSFTEVIEQCESLLKVKHQIADLPLKVECDGPDIIYGVKPQIIECIFNNIDNSYEAIRQKMDYCLNDEEKTAFIPAITLRLSHSEKSHLIVIEDNGIGIKDEDKLKVFSAFFTTKPSSKSGSGIGAYVVKRMIEENHKGRIWFNSNYKEGTTFYIELPRGEKS